MRTIKYTRIITSVLMSLASPQHTPEYTANLHKTLLHFKTHDLPSLRALTYRLLTAIARLHSASIEPHCHEIVEAVASESHGSTIVALFEMLVTFYKTAATHPTTPQWQQTQSHCLSVWRRATEHNYYSNPTVEGIMPIVVECCKDPTLVDLVHDRGGVAALECWIVYSPIPPPPSFPASLSSSLTSCLKTYKHADQARLGRCVRNLARNGHRAVVKACLEALWNSPLAASLNLLQEYNNGGEFMVSFLVNLGVERREYEKVVKVLNLVKGSGVDACLEGGIEAVWSNWLKAYFLSSSTPSALTSRFVLTYVIDQSRFEDIWTELPLPQAIRLFTKANIAPVPALTKACLTQHPIAPNTVGSASLFPAADLPALLATLLAEPDQATLQRLLQRSDVPARDRTAVKLSLWTHFRLPVDDGDTCYITAALSLTRAAILAKPDPANSVPPPAAVVSLLLLDTDYATLGLSDPAFYAGLPATSLPFLTQLLTLLSLTPPLLTSFVEATAASPKLIVAVLTPLLPIYDAEQAVNDDIHVPAPLRALLAAYETPFLETLMAEIVKLSTPLLLPRRLSLLRAVMRTMGGDTPSLSPSNPAAEGYASAQTLYYEGSVVTVATVHRDNFPDLYYTVRLQDGTEKQTVHERLSQHPPATNEWLGTLASVIANVTIHLPRLDPPPDTLRAATGVIAILLGQFDCELLKGGFLCKGLGSTHYDITNLLKQLRDGKHTDCLSLLPSAVVTCLSKTFRDFVPSVVATATLPAPTPDPAYLAFIAKHFKHIPGDQLQAVSEYVNASLHNISATKGFADAIHALRAMAGMQIVCENQSLLVDLFVGSPTPPPAFSDELLKFLVDATPKHACVALACRENAEKLLALLSASASPLTITAAYHLLSLAAASGKLGQPASDDELNFITANVQMLYPGHTLEEREQIEDDIELACKVIPKELRCRIETPERTVSVLSGDLREGQAEGKAVKVVGRCMRFLAALDYIEAACQAKEGKESNWRGSLGSYMTATGGVGDMMKFAVSCIDVEETGDKEWAKLFTRPIPLLTSDTDDSLDVETETFIGSLCSLLFFRALQTLPSVVKRWWGDELQDREIKGTALVFVEAFASKMLLKKELDVIEEVEAGLMGEMEVKGNLASGRIVASYLQDETELRVVVTVPKAFPLRNVTVDCTEAGGGGGLAVGRKWGLMMNCLVRNQDGGIIDALLMWKQNIDHEFEGVEPCPICYCVLEPKTRSMPTLKCRTCASTSFHNPCLVKWFQQSGKNVCVVCQTDWKGGYK